MSIRYRLKRNSGSVHEPIPAHPDAIYRPQNRPTPASAPPAGSGAIAPRAMANNAVVAAPLAAGENGFSPWWIIGPLLALLAAMALGALAYAMKKKHDSKKQIEEENNPGKRETNKNKEENLESDDSARKLRIENVPLRTIKPDTISEEQERAAPMLSTVKVSTQKTQPNSSGNLPPTSAISPISSTASTTQKLGQPNDRSDLNASKLKSNANLQKKENELNDFKKAPTDKSSFGQSLTNVGHVPHTELLKAGQSNKEFTLPSSRNRLNDRNTANKPGDGHTKEPNSPEQHGVGKSPLISNIPTGSKRSDKEKLQSRTNQTEDGKSSSSSNLNLQWQHSSKENIHSNKSKNLSSSSDTNKDQQPSTLTIHSKPDLLSKASDTTSSNSVTSVEPTNETNSTFSNPIYPNKKSDQHIVQPSDQNSILNKNDLNKFRSDHIQSFTNELDSNPSDNHFQSRIDLSNPKDDKSDESNTSLTQPNLTTHHKTISFMPNVPQCKTNTSSDDDDYDEIYPIPADNSPIQQTTPKP